MVTERGRGGGRNVDRCFIGPSTTDDDTVQR